MIKNKSLKFSALFIVLSIFIMSFTTSEKLTLTIEINDFRNNKGNVLLAFMDGNEKTILNVIQEVVDNKCIIKIPDLSPGKYAFKYLHDENKNEEMDFSWVGIPQEGYGFSNNAKAKLGPPDFEKIIIELKTNTTHKCNVTYF